MKASILQFSPTVITVVSTDTSPPIIQFWVVPINVIPSGIINPVSLYVPGETKITSPETIPVAVRAAPIVKKGLPFLSPDESLPDLSTRITFVSSVLRKDVRKGKLIVEAEGGVGILSVVIRGVEFVPKTIWFVVLRIVKLENEEELPVNPLITLRFWNVPILPVIETGTLRFWNVPILPVILFNPKFKSWERPPVDKILPLTVKLLAIIISPLVAA